MSFSTTRSSITQSVYLQACEIELLAFKPGNVSIYSEGHGMTVEDFRQSAEASAPYICDARLSLGEKIFRAVEATFLKVKCNTNLGIILLAAPLIHAFERRSDGESLQSSLRTVLSETTVADAEWVYQAIRLAQPGGLGTVSQQDINESPAMTLRDTMQLAIHRDRIASQYTNYFSDIFDLAIPVYHSALAHWKSEEWAAVAVFVRLLKQFPDSHIERKFGAQYSKEVASRMIEIERGLSGAEIPRRIVPLLEEVDRSFKLRGINPGTTADLTVACIIAANLENEV